DYSRVARALQWVLDNHSQYNITVVNLSLADGRNYQMNWFSQDGGVGQQISSLVAKLKAVNIPVVSGAGNSFQGQQGMGFPAIVADTISVTSTDNSDHLVADAQRLGAKFGGAGATDLAAPGTATSFSTALVSGAIVLLQQIYQ